MEQLLLAANPPRPITEEALAAEFDKRKDELRRPPRYSIEHLYFNREREAEVESVVAAIQAQGMDATEAREFSSPFLPGYRFTRQSPDQLARHFGSAFVENLRATDPQPGTWRDATLEEVRGLLQRDLESRERTRALRESIDAMRENYEVIK
jgi:hypothetical protein